MTPGAICRQASDRVGSFPAQGQTSIDLILVDDANAVALGTFSLVVKDNGRRFSMPSRSTSLSSRGAWSTSTSTPAWSPGA
ncbi:hypothetical protein ABZS88_37385 [Streptomyces sp. NPDC005480]|uniref:hypothetical protein n=1 Tax=Streptomyces sp. NPDC005480 TaxID=3154880 RepID=UPI0033BB5510